MRRFLYNEKGYVEHADWAPHCWVNVECPDSGDIDFMLHDLGIPASFLESISDADERPRIEHEGQWKLTILRVPMRLEGGETPYATIPFGIVTNGEVVLTLCYRETEMVSDFISHTRAKEIEIFAEPDFILRLIYSSTFWFLKYLKDINAQELSATRQLQRSVRNKDLLEFMKLQQSLVFFNTSLRGNQMLLSRIQRLYRDQYDRDLLEDVDIELKQANNTVNVYIEILTSAMDTFASIISNNVNDIMRKMTAISIILMVPTLIASFYGMNVDIDIAHGRYAFWVILGGSFALALLLYYFLRKIHWL
ncbi:MAG: magnesium transporter CorA family protein [Muribaculaceae bacterium]|nr:magnesium transporter CorA family protein [Muribaculaceae bacterium]